MTLHTYTPNQCPYQVSTCYTLQFLRYSPDKLFLVGVQWRPKMVGEQLFEKWADDLQSTRVLLKDHI